MPVVSRALSSAVLIVAVVLCGVLCGASSGGPAAASESVASGDSSAPLPWPAEEVEADWRWPVPGPHVVVAPYRAPAHEYGAGHRGMDLPAALGTEVRAPSAGVVAFRGTVVDRPLLTIEHPGGFVSTFEPLSTSLSPGDPVAAGDVIGTVDVGGHAAAGTLHVGARLHGEYINPMLLFGEVPRAVLLPCCDPL